MVVFDDMETERKVTIYDKGVDRPHRTYGEYIQVRSGDIHIPQIPADEPLRLECEHFVERDPRRRRPRRRTAATALAVVEVLEAMSESLARGGAVVPLAAAHGGRGRVG